MWYEGNGMICLTCVHVFVWKFMLFDCHEFNWKMIFNKIIKNTRDTWVECMFIIIICYCFIQCKLQWTLQSLIDNCCNFTNVHWFHKKTGTWLLLLLKYIFNNPLKIYIYAVFSVYTHSLLKARCWKYVYMPKKIESFEMYII